MAIVEQIPGIRRIIKTTPDDPIVGRELPSHVQVSPLQKNDIPELVELLHRGLDATPTEFLPVEDKERNKNTRTAKYYDDALDDPAYHAIFIARNRLGKLIGGLETTRFEVDGCNIGFINWVNVDPDVRQGNVAIELYRQYEEYAKQEGFAFLMANVHHTNKPSRALHRRAGFRDTPYLQKPAEANWYMKQLIPLPEGKIIPITETDFLPENALEALVIIKTVMNNRKLGEIEIMYHDKEKYNELLVSISVVNDRTRQTLQRLFSDAVDVFSANRGDSRTVEEKILQTANRLQNS